MDKDTETAMNNTPQHEVDATVRDALRSDLKTSMKCRDQVAVAAIRSALAAIDNAEAVQVREPGPAGGSADVAGSAVGLGAAETERNSLATTDMRDIIETEVNERVTAAAEYEQAGHDDAGGRLRAEADVLRGYLLPRN